MLQKWHGLLKSPCKSQAKNFTFAHNIYFKPEGRINQKEPHRLFHSTFFALLRFTYPLKQRKLMVPVI